MNLVAMLSALGLLGLVADIRSDEVVDRCVVVLANLLQQVHAEGFIGLLAHVLCHSLPKDASP